MIKAKPSILLIGAGAFGIKHLETLLNLEQKNIIEFAGVVETSKNTIKQLRKKYSFPIYNELSDSLLDKTDSVDIVTPPETHLKLILRCISRTNVLVEKPLATSAEEINLIQRAKKRSPQNVLMVGHIYRFHPVILQLKEILRKSKERPRFIKILFTNPANTNNGRDIELEMLHPFDIVDFLLDKVPTKKYTEANRNFKVVSLLYPGNIYTMSKIGWTGDKKDRTINIQFRNKQIICDLEKNTIVVYENGLIKQQINCKPTKPLETEIRAFVQAIRHRKVEYPDIKIGGRIVNVATLKANSPIDVSKKKIKVAIIGAGIFGTNCAIELAQFCDVTVFEKNNSILSEASFINQYRHHWGYHYPRSQETVNDILSSAPEFEKRYNEAIITKFPTYYAVAKNGSKVTPKQYMDFCKRNNLPYEVEMPDTSFLNREKISACLKTYEPIYSYNKLKSITKNLLKKYRVKMRLGCEIVDANILQNGQKILKIKSNNSTREEQFDYVINVTYARYNDFCSWLRFPRKPMRIDFVEVLWIKLNIPKISLAVMDGPFTNMVPTDKDGIFTLAHIKLSPLRRFVPQNGLVPKNIFSNPHSRASKILLQSEEWFPALKKAKLLKVHYVLRGVIAHREYDDSRLSYITEHGFGCFSILGGKIVNATSTAKNLASLIKNQTL